MDSIRDPAARARLDSHLEEFQFATRGRRGQSPPRSIPENEWWALGQHHGLKTPLLDWTGSPYAGAFFAFHEEAADETERRSIWGLGPIVKKASDLLMENGHDQVIEFIRPHTDENPRLVSQSGLFTRAPRGDNVDDWVREYFAGNSKDAALIRVTIPNDERHSSLVSLNRMNVNHASLFPDLAGASLFANLRLSFPDY